MCAKPKTRIPWPEFDEYEHYDNETSYLAMLVNSWDDASLVTWNSIAESLNREFENNRSAAACRRQAAKLGLCRD